MPKITVYIPTYNYARFLDAAIQSVLKQTMDDWELIVINDGSTDNTAEILEPYRAYPKIRILEHENKGLNFTNNIALRAAEGEYLMRLDADDFLDESILLVLSNILDTKPGVGLVYPDYYHVDEDGEIIEIVRRQKIGEESRFARSSGAWRMHHDPQGNSRGNRRLFRGVRSSGRLRDVAEIHSAALSL